MTPGHPLHATYFYFFAQDHEEVGTDEGTVLSPRPHGSQHADEGTVLSSVLSYTSQRRVSRYCRVSLYCTCPRNHHNKIPAIYLEFRSMISPWNGHHLSSFALKTCMPFEPGLKCTRRNGRKSKRSSSGSSSSSSKCQCKTKGPHTTMVF